MANFVDRIAESARRFAERTAIEVAGPDTTERVTYAELQRAVVRVADWLARDARVKPGDRVAILAGNDARWVETYLGILHLGAVAVPLDTNYASAQVRTIVADAGATVVFASERLRDVAEVAVLALPDPPRLARLTDPVADAAAESSTSAAPVSPGDAAVILYTSGTTADPKGVVLTHENLDAECRSAFAVIDVSERDAVLGVLPLFHALAQMANLLLPLVAGARIVFLETIDSTSLVHALQTRGITVFVCVPQFFYLIHQRIAGELSRRGTLVRRALQAGIRLNATVRDRAGWNPGKALFARAHRTLGRDLRLLITGGSRFDPGIGRALYGMGFTLLNAYGLTETSGAATIVRPGDRFTTSVGQPLPGVEIRIAATERQAVDRGAGADDASDDPVDGEICLRGPIVMREYFRRPDATASAIRDGWLHTGDLGRLDADGRLYITGRSKEIIVLSSGKNLYPEEIEAHYRMSAFVKEIAVLGLGRPGEPAAERLHAVVVPDEAVMRTRGVVNVRELMRFELETLSVQLPAHKRILSYDISRESLPRTTTGKLKRPAIERGVRERQVVADSSRPPSDGERAWLATTAHADAIAAIATRLQRSSVNPDDNLELDLGLDSMERVELLTLLEHRADVSVPPGERTTIFTVRQLVEAIERAPVGAVSHESGSPDGADAWEALLAADPDPAVAANLSKAKWASSLVLFGAVKIVGGLARGVLGFRASGHQHLPASGAFLISPNHQTYFDGFLLASTLPFRVFRRLFFVGASEYFETPMMAWVARAINILPVDPDANLVGAMQAAAAGLRQGKVLILFPEGERSIDGRPRTFRKGAAILSAQLGVPIVPVAIDGLFALWPRGRGIDWSAVRRARAHRAWLRFGPPLQVSGGNYTAGAAALQEAVTTMFTGR